jgi:hypothetical protein
MGQQPLSRGAVTNVTRFFQGRNTVGARASQALAQFHLASELEDWELAAKSFHCVAFAGGIRLIARSARAVIVRLGLTPRLLAKTEPSQMYMLR